MRLINLSAMRRFPFLHVTNEKQYKCDHLLLCHRLLSILQNALELLPTSANLLFLYEEREKHKSKKKKKMLEAGAQRRESEPASHPSHLLIGQDENFAQGTEEETYKACFGKREMK